MVLRLFRALMPKEERFLDYFCEHSEKIVAAADSLHTMLANGGDTSDCFQTICINEGQADLITKKTLLALHKTFITPFDRADIRELIVALDDTIDLIEETAQRIRIYNITQFTPEMVEMAATARACATLLREGLPLLGQITRNVTQLNTMAEEISRIEGQADQKMREGLSTLFRQEKDPIILMTKKEIYELLEEVIDRCQDVSDVISGIVTEQV
jgi:predicted phosphate transport protein (TIGR00153 family)